MKKNDLRFVLLKNCLFRLFCLFCLFIDCEICSSPAGYSHLKTAVITAESCSYIHVSTAINSASYGDTIKVPPGVAVWDDGIVIRKDIVIQGSGIDITSLISNFGSAVHKTFFDFQPDAVARARLDDFNDIGIIDVSGFTFIGNRPDSLSCIEGTHDGIYIKNQNTIPIRRIRIHHNKFNKLHRGTDFLGNVYGVVYENHFNGADLAYPLGNESDSWENLTYEFGTADNIYFEDNTITGMFFIGGGHGGRYAVRFNKGSGHNCVGMFDMHGNQPGNLHAMMVNEVYNNTFTDYENGIMTADHRGGKTLFFYNTFTGSASTLDMRIREEYCDSISPISIARVQHVNDSYYFENKLNNTSYNPRITQNSCAEVQIAENVDFWKQYTNFDGTVGVGVGEYANMPKTCTKGVGYWATDKGGNWNLKNGTANDGALYIAIDTNVWALFYIPYTYPHPLRTPKPLIPPKNLRISK